LASTTTTTHIQSKSISSLSDVVSESAAAGSRQLLPTKAAAQAGYWSITLDNFSHSEQAYVSNTAVLATRLYSKSGDAVEVLDFCPFFTLYGRTHHPWAIYRRVTPLKGMPRISIQLRPTYDYGGKTPKRTHGSNHVRFLLPEETLRITTDVPVSFLLKEVPFVLDQQYVMVLGPDESLSRPPADVYREFLKNTVDDWRGFVRLLAVPLEWQSEVIRSAITLRLCQLHDTGAIVAAMTTSIPEYPDSGRCWDYRFCWLRDAYFVVLSLNRLGATDVMEKYIGFLLNIIATYEEGDMLEPCFGVLPGVSDLNERICTTLSGYRGMGPVRIGNEAYVQVQNDVFGSIILACTQYFFDERLHLDRAPSRESAHAAAAVAAAVAASSSSDSLASDVAQSSAAASSPSSIPPCTSSTCAPAFTDTTANEVHSPAAASRDVVLFAKLEMLGREAVKRFDTHDAGIWEVRGQDLNRVHTHSAVLCWAACDRLAKIASSPRIADVAKASMWRAHADRLHAVIDERAFSAKQNSFVTAFDTEDIDAALLVLPELGFCAYTDPRFLGTLERVERELKVDSHVKRYLVEDDFGHQKIGFNVCTFWLINCLHGVGRIDEARALFIEMLHCANHLGLLSEDYDPESQEQHGNMCQTYSHSSVISAALLLSRPWSDVI
jgi:GH15 family glucan-1,4-alpha-glucosidase